MSDDNQKPMAERQPIIQLNPKGKLAAALAKAQKSLKSPTKGHKVDYKDKSGREIKYSYADLADCIEALKDPLADNGLSYVQTLEFREIGKTFLYGLVTTLMHESGEWTESFHPLPEPGQARPQEFGSALTYARRYSVSAITGMASEEDDDGALATKGMDTGKNQGGGNKQQTQAKNGQAKGTPQKPQPEHYVMPVGSDGVKGKQLGELPTNVLGQILGGAEAALTKSPEDKGWKLIKANVELVIKNRSKKTEPDNSATHDTSSEPDLNDVFPPDDAGPGPDIENHSQEQRPKKPQPEDFVMPDDFGVDGLKGKNLGKISEGDLRKVIKTLDASMKKTPPPSNVTALFEVRSKIVEFFKSMDLKV